MIEVFFDYTCGFSQRARHWLDALPDVEVCWRPFSLLEVNRRAEGPPVFERAEHAQNVSLTALAVHEAVRADGGDLTAPGHCGTPRASSLRTAGELRQWHRVDPPQGVR